MSFYTSPLEPRDSVSQVGALVPRNRNFCTWCDQSQHSPTECHGTGPGGQTRPCPHRGTLARLPNQPITTQRFGPAFTAPPGVPEWTRFLSQTTVSSASSTGPTIQELRAMPQFAAATDDRLRIIADTIHARMEEEANRAADAFIGTLPTPSPSSDRTVANSLTGHTNIVRADPRQSPTRPTIPIEDVELHHFTLSNNNTNFFAAPVFALTRAAADTALTGYGYNPGARLVHLDLDPLFPLAPTTTHEIILKVVTGTQANPATLAAFRQLRSLFTYTHRSGAPNAVTTLALPAPDNLTIGYSVLIAVVLRGGAAGGTTPVGTLRITAGFTDP